MKRYIVKLANVKYGILPLTFILLLLCGCSNKSKSSTDSSSNENEEITPEEQAAAIVNLAKVAADAESLCDFQEGLAGFKKDGKIGVINKKGEIIVSPTYDGMLLYKKGSGHPNDLLYFDGMALVRRCIDFTKGEEEFVYGYIDKNGKEVIPCTFEDASHFSEGYASVKKDGKYGVIDKSGKQIIPFKYDGIGDFQDGIAEVFNEGQYGFINTKGEEVIPLGRFESGSCGYGSGFFEGMAAISVKDDSGTSKYGFINKSGEVVVKPIYSEVYPFSEGRALVSKDEKYGFIDAKGKEIIPLIYDDSRGTFFSGGIAVVCKEEKYQVIDKSGKALTEAKYTSFDKIANGLAVLGYYDENRYGIVDKSGKEIFPIEYGYGKIDVHRNDEYICICKNDKYGLYDKNGKQVIPCVYDQALGDFSDGLARVVKNGVWGYVDESGRCTLDIQDETVKAVVQAKIQKAEEEEREKQEKVKKVAEIAYQKGYEMRMSTRELINAESSAHMEYTMRYGKEPKEEQSQERWNVFLENYKKGFSDAADKIMEKINSEDF